MRLYKLMNIIMLLIIPLTFTSCGKEEEIQIEIDDSRSAEDFEMETENFPTSNVYVGSLKGAMGVGILNLMELEEKQETYNSYHFTIADSTKELTDKFLNDEIQIAALPTNIAFNLYNETNGNVQIAAINTLSTFNLVENGDSIKSIDDLANKTIYAVGEGDVLEYALNYILKENSVDNVKIEFKEPSELESLMVSGEVKIGILPEPQVSIAMSANPNLKIALDITKEWEKVSDSAMAVGCIAVQKEYASKHPRVFGHFLQEYYASITKATENIPETVTLAEKFEMISKADIAEKAVSNCSLVYIDGDEMKTIINEFLPTILNTTKPNDDFFYTPKEKYAVKKK